MLYKIILPVLFLFSFFSIAAQDQLESDTPEIGKQCPEINFKELRHYSLPAANLSSFKGKWLVLDFWDSHCAACVSSFKKTSDLQKKFKNEVQFLLVGQSDIKWNKDIRQLYEKYRTRQNLDLPVAYDSVLWERFHIWADPFILILDPNGIVSVMTISIDEKNIDLLIHGENAAFIRYPKAVDYIKNRNKFNLYKPYLINNNGAADSDFVRRSVLAKWNGDSMVMMETDMKVYVQKARGLYQIAGACLRTLYNLAYFGKTSLIPADSLFENNWSFPILNIKNKDTVDMFNGDWSHNNGLYIYSTSFPPEKSSVQYIMDQLKNDLKSYFGFTVHIETRDIPVWKLVAIPGKIEQHKTRGGKENNLIKAERDGLIVNNVSTKRILASLYGCFQPKKFTDKIFIDDTNISWNLDINLDAAMADLDDVTRALQANGMDLVPGFKKMNVLVISDPS